MTTKPAAKAYRFVGRHLDNLHDGRTLEPFATVHLTPSDLEHPENQRLFDEKLLQELDVPEPAPRPKKRRGNEEPEPAMPSETAAEGPVEDAATAEPEASEPTTEEKT